MKNIITSSFTILLFAGFISSCSGLKAVLPSPKNNELKTISLITTSNVNQSTAVAVDVVFVFEQTLAEQLIKYTPRNWFKEKEQYQRQYVDKLVVFNHEMVPVSQEILRLKDERKRFNVSHKKAVRVIIFANYLKDSTYYTIDITSHQHPVITLDQIKLTIAEYKQS